MQLKEHQSRNAEQLLQALGRYGAALDGSDTGTGKTATAIGLCAQLGAKPAIVCPLACVPSWRDTCAALGVAPAFIANYEQCRSESFPHGKFTANIEKHGKPIKANYVWAPQDKRVIFVFDEAQRCRAPASLNSKMFLAAQAQFKTMMLSATPFCTPLEAYPIGRALQLFNKNNYQRWCYEHGCRVDRQRGMGLVFRGDEKDLGRIHAAIFPERGVRTRRSEIPGFPLSNILTRSVETAATDDITAAYLADLKLKEQADWDKARGQLPEDLAEEFGVPLAITLNLRARQKAELMKCDVMADMARDAVDRGESVAIFVNFDASIELLRQYLKTDCVLRGQRTAKCNRDMFDRENAIRLFQRDTERIILVNSAAGGAGTNLHGVRERRAIISPPWSAIVLKQVLGRVHRLGGSYSTQEIIFAHGTVEEKVMKKVQANLNNLDALVDGDLAIDE